MQAVPLREPTLADPDSAVLRDGVVLGGVAGSRVHPAAVEARLQRTALARLLEAMKFPRDGAAA